MIYLLIKDKALLNKYILDLIIIEFFIMTKNVIDILYIKFLNLSIHLNLINNEIKIFFILFIYKNTFIHRVYN